MASLAQAQELRQSPLPKPTGESAVGRTQFDWTDESRADPENQSGHREIVVWVWYPAAPRSGAEPAEWMPRKWGELFWSDYLNAHPNAAEAGKQHPINTIRTHAYTDAPAASSQRPYPILLFAPGMGDTPLDYSGVIEDVVSHGYIVADKSGAGRTQDKERFGKCPIGRAPDRRAVDVEDRPHARIVVGELQDCRSTQRMPDCTHVAHIQATFQRTSLLRIYVAQLVQREAQVMTPNADDLFESLQRLVGGTSCWTDVPLRRHYVAPLYDSPIGKNTESS